MTEEARDLVLAGFAAGLREHAMKLFSVYTNCQDQAGYERCVRGLANGIAAYETLVQCVEQNGRHAVTREASP